MYTKTVYHQAEMPNKRDRITGTWKTIKPGRPDVIIDTNPKSNRDRLYFGIATSGRDRTINYSGYIDSDRNKIFNLGKDDFIGKGSVTSLDGIVYNRGTFVSKGSSWEGFVGSTRVAIGYGVGEWFY